MGKKRLLITVILSLLLVWCFSFVWVTKVPKQNIIHFSEKEIPLIMDGFSYPERWGRWTNSEKAHIKFKLSNPVKNSLDIKLKLRAFARKDYELNMNVFVNGAKYDEWHFKSQTSGDQVKILKLSSQYLQSKEITISFVFSDLLSPKQLGLNNDVRKLGLGLISMETIPQKNIGPLYDFDYLYFIIVSTFSILFSYKIVQYLTRFKILEHNSRIDIVFLCVFFVLLFIPMSRIDHSEKSTQENRMLAKYIPLVNDSGKINPKYGKDFEAWFNDRFCMRTILIKIYDKLKFNINRYYANSKAMTGYDDWLFPLADFNSRKFLLTNQNEICSGVNSLKQFCEKYGIKCYIEVVPSRADFNKTKIFQRNFQTGKYVEQLIEEIFKRTGVSIIYPKHEMKKAKIKDFIFFKTDHHWTEWGAYIGYFEFMQKVKKDFPEISPLNENEFYISYRQDVRANYNINLGVESICKMLNIDLPDCKQMIYYKKYNHKLKENLKYKLSPKGRVDYYYPDGIDKRVVIIGNSFIENFNQFLPYSFKNVLSFRTNYTGYENFNLSRWKEDILKYKAEILLILIHAETAGHLSELKD